MRTRWSDSEQWAQILTPQTQYLIFLMFKMLKSIRMPTQLAYLCRLHFQPAYLFSLHFQTVKLEFENRCEQIKMFIVHTNGPMLDQLRLILALFWVLINLPKANINTLNWASIGPFVWMTQIYSIFQTQSVLIYLKHWSEHFVQQKNEKLWPSRVRCC